MNIRVEDSSKIESNNLSTSSVLVINDIRNYIVKNNNKYTYTRQWSMYNGKVLKNQSLDSLNIGKVSILM